eukprot:scaffold107744_cov39-Phaeocystis_antarctica.AAC.1
MVELRNAGEQLPAEMLASGQFRLSARSRPHCGVRRSPLVHWRLKGDQLGNRPCADSCSKAHKLTDCRTGCRTIHYVESPMWSNAVLARHRWTTRDPGGIYTGGWLDIPEKSPACYG